MDHILPSCYYGESGRLVSELEPRLPHCRPIFKNDNHAVCMNIEETARGISVESTNKYFSRRKDGHGAFQALISNHAGEVKHRVMSNKTLNLLQNIK